MSQASDIPAAQILPLLQQGGLGQDYQLTALRGGGNNRVYRVDCASGQALLKAYFQHPDDPRDRLGTEFSFCKFAWDSGLRCLPAPLACDAQNKLGLYEFIAGRVLLSSDIGPEQMQQATDFFSQLNAHKSGVSAARLPAASDAAFSLAQHVARVGRRMNRLQTLDASTPAGLDANALAQSEIIPRWRAVEQRILLGADALEGGFDQPLAAEDRCLSPSDFGFHNALAQAGRVRFIDFEYAGWDDPAKTVCDFFCHPGVPVSRDYFGAFQDAVLASLPHAPMHRQRIAMLMPLFELEWCCILLNEFLPLGHRRRAFAKGQQDPEERRLAQLAKVRRALGRFSG